MKYKILLYGLVAVMVTGCSSAYKATQTPDDVYYSPASVQKQTKNEDKYEDYVKSDEDQYLRMKIRDRQRWSALDDYEYWNDSRYVPSFSYNYYRNNWYNAYAWNNWNSPYYYPMYAGSYNYYGYYYPQFGYNPYSSNVYVVKYPTKPATNVNRPNLNGYTNRTYSNSNNSNSNRQGFGSTLKRVFSPSNNSNYSNRNTTNSNNTNNTYTAPTRTYSPSSSSSGSSSSSSGSSSGGVSRPPRN